MSRTWEVYKSSKTGKGIHKLNAGAAISRNWRSDIELFHKQYGL